MREETKRKFNFNFFKICKYDIIALQETHQSNAEFRKWQKEWNGKSVWNHGTAHSKGVAFLFKPYLNIKIIGKDMDFEGRILRVTLEMDGTRFQVLNIYGYNPSDEARSEEFFEYLNQFIEDDIPLMIFGDFNMVLDMHADRKGGHPRNTHTYGKHALNNILGKHSLCDIWKTSHPNERKYTWENTTKKTYTAG